MIIDQNYIECPNCGKWYSNGELLSYSNFGGSECWSDGKCINYDLSEYSFMPFSKCNECNNFFWIETCRKIYPYELYDYFEEKASVDPAKIKMIKIFLRNNKEFEKDESAIESPDYPFPHYWENLPKHFIPDLLELLKQKNLNLDNELYVRFKLWQHINDFVRNQKHPFIRIFTDTERIHYIKNFKENMKFYSSNKKLYKQYRSLKKQNLLKLRDLLRNEGREKLYEADLSLIEVERELGNFAVAKTLLNNLDPAIAGQNKRFTSITKNYIARKSTKIFEIK